MDTCGYQPRVGYFYHLGGNGPWIQKMDRVLHNDLEPLEECVVDLVHMLSRHAELNPTMNAGQRKYALLAKRSCNG